MNEQETIEDIIAEMRFHGQQNVDAEKEKPEYGILTVEGRIAQNYADRLKAAYKRERAKIEADALAVGGIVEASRKRERGNSAKLREAMLSIKADILKRRSESVWYTTDSDILEKINAALASPPRNCDRYSHNEALQVWASEKWNERNGCFDEWLYEISKEGGVK